VATDRAAYHYRIQRSILFKDSLSMIVDGADMARYSIPYFCVNDKQSSEGWKIPLRLYGAILHGEFSAAYLYPANLPGGTNVTVEVIHRVLTLYTEGIVSCAFPTHFQYHNGFISIFFCCLYLGMHGILLPGKETRTWEYRKSVCPGFCICN
jgi:hypothetical protein